MKKLKILPTKILATFLLFTIASCKKSENLVFTEKITAEFSPLDEIKKRGFSIKNIREFDTFYLVEGDVIIFKKDLITSSAIKQNRSRKEISQASSTYKVGSGYGYNINISLSSMIWQNSIWYNALVNALKVWNSTSSSDIKLNLIYTSLADYSQNPTRIDIAISEDNGVLPSNWAAGGAFPNSSEQPGSAILINTDYLDSRTNFGVTIAQATHILIHEIGHCLGLRHTDWYLIGEGAYPYGAYDIANTPSSFIGDPNSIMNGYNAAFGSYNFTNFPNLPSIYDSIAIGEMYPLNISNSLVPYISGNKYLDAYGEDNFVLSYLEVGTSYVWTVSGINGTVYNETFPMQNTEKLQGVGFPSGSYRITCTVTSNKYGTQVMAIKDIVVR